MDRQPDPLEVLLERHATVLDAGNRFGAALADFARHEAGMDTGAWLRTEEIRSGSFALGQIVEAYAEAGDRELYVADARVFSRDNDSPMSATLDSTLFAITVGLIAGRGDSRFDLEVALRLVFGVDPVSQLFAAALDGRLPIGDDDRFSALPEIPPRDKITLEKLNGIACYGGLRDALTDVERAAAAIGRTKPYPGMTILELRPRNACPGDTLRVVGSGFGSHQPADAVVVFGSVRATIVRGSWSANEFSVVVPAGVAECCVSVLQVPSVDAGGGGTLSSAVGELAGVIGECFGTVGISVGVKIAGLADRIPDSEDAVCAPDGSNRFTGGSPRITSFRTGLSSAEVRQLRQGSPIDLEWSVVNASTVSIAIAPHSANSILAVTPSLPSWFVPNPTSGRVPLPCTLGLIGWKVDVTLSATNACGTVSRSIELVWNPALGFVFVGGGMRSCFDLGALEALALLLPDGPAVCSGSGLGALSAACAAADFKNPVSLRSFWGATVSDASWYQTSAQLHFPGHDFSAVTTAEWQARARAEVLSMDALGMLRAFLVPHRTGDDREVEGIIADLAGAQADKVVDVLNSAVAVALEESGQAAMSYVPIVAIIWGAAKFAFATWQESLVQQTAALLAAVPSIFNDGGLRGLITQALVGIDQRIALTGRRVRIPLTSLERGRALYGLEGGALSEAPIGSQIRATTTIEGLVQASATVPLLGGPKLIGTDHWVDGSVLDPVPIGATIEAGAGAVVVVQPHVRLVTEQATFAAAGVPRVDARTSVLRDAHMLDAGANAFGRFSRDPVTRVPVGGWRSPVHVIEPTVDLVGLGASIGQSGLVNVMTDYGYMRAYDVLVPWMLFPDETKSSRRAAMAAELLASTDRIIGLRVKSWESEHILNAMRATPFGPTSRLGSGLVAVPVQGAIGDIRAIRIEIRAALVDRLSIAARYEPFAGPGIAVGTVGVEPIPRPRAESWVQSWEKYDFYQLVAPNPITPAQPNGDPWVSLGYSQLWVEPAATRPALLWP